MDVITLRDSLGKKEGVLMRNVDVSQQCHCDRHLPLTAVCHTGQIIKYEASVAILAQAILVHHFVHIAIDSPSSIIIMSHSKAANIATSRLEHDMHVYATKLGIEFAKGTSKSRVVFIRDELVSIFGRYIMKMRLHADQVGIMPMNRDSGQLTSSACCIRGHRIIESGFSFAAIGIPYAFEDDPVDQLIAKHTIAVTQGPDFGNFELSVVRVGSANWTHSNNFMVMVKDEALCSDPKIPCIDGHIDSNAILGDPANCRMKVYFSEGMVWNVFPAWIAKQYTFMPKIFQAADNQVAQVQEGENFVQMLQKIGNRVSDLLGSEMHVCPDAVAVHVMRTQPPNQNDVPPMVDFYLKWGGGRSKIHVSDFAEFFTVSNFDGQVRISGRTFAALASLKFGTEMPASAVVAVVKRLIACKIANDGIASSITLSEISKFDKGLKTEFLLVDRMIKESQKMMDDNDIEPREQVITGGWLQMSLIDTILEKPNKDGTKFESCEDVLKEFLKKLFGVVKTEASTADPASSLVDYDVTGAAIGVTKMILTSTEGFKVGNKYTSPTRLVDSALRLAEPIAWKLITIDDDGNSTLQKYSSIGVLQTSIKVEGEEATPDTITVKGEELVHHFKPFTKEYKMVVDYPKNEPKHSKDIMAEILEDRIREALLMRAREIPDHQLIVRTDPTKAVFADKEFAVGKLKLSPFAKVVHAVGGKVKAATDPRQSCTLTSPAGGISVYTTFPTPVGKDLCNAFYQVHTTDVECHANMALQDESAAFILASATKLKIQNNEYKVMIPILVNTSIIKKGDELQYYVPKVEVVKKERTVRPLEVANKRIKVSPHAQ